jgi:hypothetical protein
MNIPNFAACHQAILCARVAACVASAAETVSLLGADWGVVAANDSALAEYARAEAAPTCFKNERLEIASIVIFSPQILNANSCDRLYCDKQ